MAYLEYFPEPLLQLREEIEHHPDLKVILLAQQESDIYVQLAEIALYCGILLNATYSREDVLKLCEIMTAHLYKKRAITIIQ